MKTVATPEEAVSRIPDGARIVVPPGLSFGPDQLLNALGQRRFQRGVQLLCSLNSIPRAVVDNPGIEIAIWQLFGGTRALCNMGRASFLPMRYSEFPKAFGRHGTLRPDVMLAQLPPPCSDGAISPGAVGSIFLDIARSTRLVIAEFSKGQPVTQSLPLLTTSHIDVGVEVDVARPVMRSVEASPEEQKVAKHVAALIPDRATLQLGIGGAVDAVLNELRNHQGLGVHSGLISDGLVPLIESGVITNEHKGSMRGKTVGGIVAGTERLLDWAHLNEDLLVVPAKTSHGLRSLSKVRSLTAINSAIEVDLSGQVNAEYLRGREFSGVGGQGDFAFAASTNDVPGNVSIVALTSTSRDGSASRIVPKLGEGVTITTPRYCVDFVVTEFGAAELRAKTLEQRAAALAAIAHPSHREDLARHASEI